VAHDGDSRFSPSARFAGTAKNVLVVLHDLEKPIRHTDRLLGINQGKQDSEGPPDETLTKDILDEVFQVKEELNLDEVRMSLEIQGESDWDCPILSRKLIKYRRGRPRPGSQHRPGPFFIYENELQQLTKYRLRLTNNKPLDEIYDRMEH
jgi:ABC-type multidrug transport system ATPase subunit